MTHDIRCTRFFSRSRSFYHEWRAKSKWMCEAASKTKLKPSVLQLNFFRPPSTSTTIRFEPRSPARRNIINGSSKKIVGTIELQSRILPTHTHTHAQAHFPNPRWLLPAGAPRPSVCVSFVSYLRLFLVARARAYLVRHHRCLASSSYLVSTECPWKNYTQQQSGKQEKKTQNPSVNAWTMDTGGLPRSETKNNQHAACLRMVLNMHMYGGDMCRAFNGWECMYVYIPWNINIREWSWSVHNSR